MSFERHVIDGLDTEEEGMCRVSQDDAGPLAFGGPIFGLHSFRQTTPSEGPLTIHGI